MEAAAKVNFHCHSKFSDGALWPEDVAEELGRAGVSAASLTDHDTTEGLAAFRAACERRGIGYISGVEMTVALGGSDEAHLLAYGFDPAHEGLQQALLAVRQSRGVQVQSVAESLRQLGGSVAQDLVASGVVTGGRMEACRAIALVHEAGGKAFLAHPYFPERTPEALDGFVAALKSCGLDGIEAIYGPYSADDQRRLMELAHRHSLLVSAGGDFHGVLQPEAETAAVTMDRESWQRFRAAVMEHSARGGSVRPGHGGIRPDAPHRLRWRRFALHVVFPALLTLTLFLATIFGFVVPMFEQTLLDQKREMIRQLINSAWSILSEHEQDERAGKLTREQAQEMAKSRIEFLRYGREGKDYFWLQDLQPRMIMHPYRKDLNGKDVSDFKDPRGVRIFVEFAELVKRRQEGYLDYVWQWKDDPDRLVPKESYIKGFEPWGWVIGTGIYIEDVEQETGRITRRLIHVSLGITGLLALLLLYVVQQSLRIERDRRGAEEALRLSHEKYRSLVEAATEGTLLAFGGRCSYANRTMLDMLGYSEAEIALLDLHDLLPSGASDAASASRVIELAAQSDSPASLEGALRRWDGSWVECILAVNRMTVAGRDGLILLAKELRPGQEVAAEADERLRRMGATAANLPTGIFRARAARRCVVIDANPAARASIGAGRPDDAELALADLFQPQEFDALFRELVRDGKVADRLVHVATEQAGVRVLSVSLVLVRDEQQQPKHIDGTIEDVTLRRKREKEMDGLVERLQTSMLFLQEPLKHIAKPPVVCALDMPVGRAAAAMARAGSDALLVRAESGAIVGIVTDRDLRERVLVAGAATTEPVYRFMSSPLVSISENAQIYEALALMQDRGVQHLAVSGEGGAVVSLVRNKELLQFQRYGSLVLTREIARADTPDAIGAAVARLPALVQALVECGARPRSVTRIITSVCDAATSRLVELAIAELGPPPAPFAFIALGSQGREEQTLSTDQDNAIIFDPAGEAGAEAARDYFVKLGGLVSGWLEQAGYAACTGGIMARNSKWVMPLAAWKDRFASWITKAEPQELLDCSIFFDLRVIHGEAELAERLRHHIDTVLRDSPQFWVHFSQHALEFKPPVWLFGKLIMGGATGEQSNSLNLKDMMMPMVSFGRLYSLRHEMRETSTLNRVERLAELDLLSVSTRDEIAAAYEFLMRLRLQHQAAMVKEGRAPDNVVGLKRLTHIDETLLKQAFAEIAAIQKKIGYDFLGGTQ